MLPQTNQDLIQDFKLGELPTNTFKLNILENTIAGFVQGREAMQQAIYLILNIERYTYLIYSWNYGVELADLFGLPTALVLPEIERRVTEALQQDKRITGVEDFDFTVQKNKVLCTFRIKTIFGDVEAEKVVQM